MSEMLVNLQEVPIQIWIVFTLLFLIAVVSFILTRKKKTQSDKEVNTKVLVFGGMCIALSFLLSFIKILQMPQGGSVTLASMFPIALYAFVCGPTAGIIAGLAYGILQFLQDAFAAHWVSIIVDYPLAFACLGLTGYMPILFNPLKLHKQTAFTHSISFQFSLGLFIAILGRFLMHVLSGAIFFGSYAPEGMNPWIYSMTYNISYLGVEFIITLILGIILLNTPIYKSIKTSILRTY